MKTLTTTMLGLTLVMTGFVYAQSMTMDERMGRTDDMEMKSDSMKTEDDGMKKQADDMKMESDDMIKDNDQQMKDDMHKEKDEMKMNKTSIPTDQELQSRLTPLQYHVTRKDGTEPPFNNTYWDNHAPGIYVDIISGAPLFSSTDKYDSGTGWPSFTRPLDPEQIVEKKDRSFFTVRTEIRSKDADAHLGHVFNDGPAPTGLRYCMNSASLRFVPQADLEKEGYTKYAQLFK